ncbi:oligosaccharide flippase family protein [Neomegalonema sp.]|uniref:oligosaccharide flippase family protein n=1 Tax=Neomegalonema sp. TaxID=2039713 RepID=UPI002619DBED|nr:oligosaccharide flippase family protein [Neomegalonema sp.]MDD2867240.1 oligosaccharide flippase family protein [Neomegalonema sp.]
MTLSAPSAAAPETPREGASDIGRRMAGGALWTIGARLLPRLAGLMSMMLMARLLTPADFGVVTLAMAVMLALQAFSDLGLNAVLIHDQQAGRDHYDTVWTLTLLRGLLIASALWLGAGRAAEFFAAPALEAIAGALALGALMEGLRSPAAVNLVKGLDFRRDALYVALPRLTQTFSSMGLALAFWPDSRALTGGILIGGALGLILSYRLAPWRPRFTFRALGAVIDYAKWMFAFNILEFLRQKFDALLIGRMLGPGAVSLYLLAHELAHLAATEIAAPARRALLPGYAKLQNDLSALRRDFGVTFAAVALAAAPMAAGVALIADPLVAFAFGPQWTEAAPVLRILALAGFLTAAAGNCQPVLMATGAPRGLAPISLASLVVGASGMALGLRLDGLQGGAWGVVAMSAVYFGLNLRAALKRLDLPPGATLAPGRRIPWATAAMALVVWSFLRRAPEGTPPALLCLAAAGLGAVVYVAALWGLWRAAGRPEGAESLGFGLMARLLRRKAS